MHILRFFILLSCITAYLPMYGRIKKKNIQPYHTPCTSLKKGPVTLYVHGTIFSGISRIMHHDTNRRGLYAYTAPLSRAVNGKERLGKILHDADPQKFPVHSFYKFYWDGKLSETARKEAAKKLFTIIKNHTGPLTLIAHSHGCNVVLHLAQHAQEKKSKFLVDKLILLAAPVQKNTSSFIASPFFKRVYSFYSTADALQIADPQGIHKKENVPLFSERTYRPSPHLIQTRLLIGRRSPRHIDFITGKFFKHLPKLLTLLDTQYMKGNKHIMVNIPRCGNDPHVLTFTSAALPYQSRKKGQCTCKMHPLMA